MQETPKALAIRQTEAYWKTKQKALSDTAWRTFSEEWWPRWSSWELFSLLHYNWGYIKTSFSVSLSVSRIKGQNCFPLAAYSKIIWPTTKTELVNGALITWLHITCYVPFLWILSLYLLWKRPVLTLIAGGGRKWNGK